DWAAPRSPRPPGTIANPLRDIQPARAEHRPRPLGDAFRIVPVEDLVGAPFVDHVWAGIDLAPDGGEVAFSWNRSGIHEIFSARLDGERIYQLTDAGERSVSPRYSPDGGTIAFLRDHGGNEKLGIWLVDRDGRRARDLTSEPEVTHRDIDWSPDGASIAYVADPGGGRFAVHVVRVATGERRALTDGAYEDAEPRWSPDGKWIAFTSHRDAVRTNADLYLVAAEGGTAVRLDTRDGTDGESFDARWARDGARIAFTTNLRGRYEIGIATLHDRAVARVELPLRTPYDATEAVWRPDGRGVVYLHSQDSQQSVRNLFMASRADSPIADLPGVHRWARVAPDSETVAFVFSGARRPHDVWVRRAGTVEPRAITTSLAARVDPATLVEPAHVRYPGADGREIPALLYVPHQEALGAGQDGAAPPGIVYAHGGPTGQHFRWWDPTPQILANRGYVVLAPNVRGSTGYGREFQEANRRDWGGKDLEDVVRGADWLEREGIVDGERLGVHGGSYGGYMTLLCLARAPERWAAGVSVVGVVSLKTLFETTRGDLKEYLLREIGDPAEEAGFYRERSPLTHAASIRAPLLILQGANDPRVPLSEAEHIVKALRDAGKTHGYRVYTDEGHGFTKTENRVDALQRTLDWFDRHLAPAAG
ncbi:MAG: S9 family peptidase, partial [Candidatus Limnocylindria bacterium]